jgi:dTDP-4-dehydrorhamnose 3,5-epimerase
MSEFQFKEGEIEGYLILEGTSFDDHRGSFSRLYSRSLFSANSSFKGIEHVNLSVNPEKYTLRGFHYSLVEAEEIKVFKCITGGIFNVTIDVRKNSATYGKKKVVELSSSDRTSIVVPAGCANAWMTMQADTRLLYFVSAEYQSLKERGFRFDDPHFGIDWPSTPRQISSKDLGWEKFVS